jgi:hypothetical protein
VEVVKDHVLLVEVTVKRSHNMAVARYHPCFMFGKYWV